MGSSENEGIHEDQSWNEKRGAFTAEIGIDDLDASVPLLPEIGLLETHDPRFVRTVKAIESEFLRDKHVMRYASEDDFGPETAFLICRFWLIDVLWDLGRREQAREMFNDAPRYRNRYWQRIFIPARANCGAIFLRPTPWPG
jgi:GH15 family glucan-1,4-alpha-glucosidase